MRRVLLQVGLFVLVLVASFMWIGHVVTDLSGVQRGPGVTLTGVSREVGQQIFWGKGKCSTCHSIGTEGSAIRCPNLGVAGEKFPLPIGRRAAERAAERSKQVGKAMSATDYLVESITRPDAFVVPGYKNEMPIIWRPPIALNPDELRSVLLYLQSLGGDEDLAAITLPAQVVQAAEAAQGAPQVAGITPYLEGDAELGEELFSDVEYGPGCIRCHTVRDTGGKIGPDLSTIGGTRPLAYIVESILHPSAVIVNGYETYMVTLKAGQILTGTLKGENDQEVHLGTSEGEITTIARGDIAVMEQQEVSTMPSNFAELITVEDFHHILAFLLSLQ